MDLKNFLASGLTSATASLLAACNGTIFGQAYQPGTAWPKVNVSNFMHSHTMRPPQSAASTARTLRPFVHSTGPFYDDGFDQRPRLGRSS